MIVSLLIGVVVGFALAIPPGPMSVTCIRYGLQGRRRDGTKIALGSATLDILSAMIAAFASSAIVSSLQSFIENNPVLVTVIQIICIGVLAFLGVKYLRQSPKHTQEENPSTLRNTSRFASSSHFLIGIGIAFTSAIAPTFFPSLVGIISLLHAREWVGNGFADNMLFAVGFGAGVFLWLSLLLRTIHTFRERLSVNFLRTVYTVAGGAFIVFAIVLAYKVLVGLGGTTDGIQKALIR